MKKIYYCIIFFVLYFVIISYSIGFDYNNIIDGGDTDIFLNPKLAIDKFYSIWDNDGTGIALPMPGVWIIHSIPLYLLSFVSKESSLLYFVILFSLAPISIFLLISELIKDNNIVPFFIGIFYSFNLYTAIEFHTPVYHILYFFGIMPLLVFIFLKIMNSIGKKRIFFLMIYVILFLPLTRIFQIFTILIFLIPLLSIILNRETKITRNDFIKLFILSTLIIILISAPFIIGIFQDIGWTKNIENQKHVKSSLVLTKDSNITDSLRLIGTYAWKNKLYDEISGIQAFNFAQYYQENLFFVIMSFYFIFLPAIIFFLTYRRLEKNERFKIYALFVTGLVLIFLIQYMYLLSQISDILSTAFRSSWQYFTPIYILSVSLILAILLNKVSQDIRDKRKILILFSILIIFQIIYILPTLIENPLHKSWIVNIPREYYDTANFLNQKDDEFRVLPLPLSKHFTGYTPYKWNYTGPDVLHTLINKQFIDKHVSMVAPDEYLGVIERLENAKDEDIIQLAKKLNIRYVLLRNDVDMNHRFYIKLVNSPEFYKKIFENSSEVKNIYIFGNLTLYEIDGYYPKIFDVPTDSPIYGKSVLDIYNKTFYKFQNVTYIYFDDAPLIINKSQKYDTIDNINLSVRFTLENKNKTGDWRYVNHVLIQTDILKVAISPYGLLHVFIYLKNDTFVSMVEQVDKSDLYDEIDLDIIFANNTVYVYKNNMIIDYMNVSNDQIYNGLDVVKVGSNFGNSEKLKGRIYDLSLMVNNRIVVNNSMLYEYNQDKRIESRKVTSISSYNKLNWVKISPTKYKIDINNEESKEFFVLFLETYSTKWKAYISDGVSNRQIPEDFHVKFFDYANGWYINRPGNYTITVEYMPQRLYDLGLIISMLSLTIIISILIIPDQKLTKIKRFLGDKIKVFNRENLK